MRARVHPLIGPLFVLLTASCAVGAQPTDEQDNLS
jgi:hypothetical protein